MKRRLFTVLMLLAAAFFLGGCFSLAAEGGWEGNKHPSKAVKTAAVAADVATLPLQAGALVVLGAAQDATRKAGGQQPPREAKRVDLRAEIMANPNYIFSHRLDLTNDMEARSAVVNALWDGAKFTDAQLRRLYQALPMERPSVLKHPNCSDKFLREAFAALPGIQDRYDLETLWGFFGNPHLPLDILERMAADPDKYSPAIALNARVTIAQRKAGS